MCSLDCIHSNPRYLTVSEVHHMPEVCKHTEPESTMFSKGIYMLYNQPSNSELLLRLIKYSAFCIILHLAFTFSGLLFCLLCYLVNRY